MGKEFLSPMEEFKGVRGRACCLTGDFNYGTKDTVKDFIVKHGGRISNGVSRETTVLVVGEKGNANWAHGNYGRKVEVALLAKKEGKEVCIIAENDFFRAMKDMPDGGTAPEPVPPKPEKQYSITDDLATAKDCLDDVINGSVDITDPEVADVIAYTSGVLGILLEERWKPKSERKIKARGKGKKQFFISRERAVAYQLKDEPISAHGMALELSTLREDMVSMRRCSAWIIQKWLVAQGYYSIKNPEERRTGTPSPAGIRLGMSLHPSLDEGEGPYVVFDRNAQQFIIDHIEEICRFSFR